MSTLGNFLWIFLGGGLFISIYYLISGVACCLTIIGIPFGLQCFKLAHLALIPFDRDLIERDTPPTSTLNLILNILWLILFGITLAISHLIFAFILSITIIGFPFAAQHMKLIKLSLFPFGQRIDHL